FHRLMGDDVLMVSGSDEHGTPIIVRADQEGRSPEELTDYYHTQFLETWRRFGISFDLFTRTGTANHREVVHELFLRMLNDGHITLDTMQALYCPYHR